MSGTARGFGTFWCTISRVNLCFASYTPGIAAHYIQEAPELFSNSGMPMDMGAHREAFPNSPVKIDLFDERTPRNAAPVQEEHDVDTYRWGFGA